MIYNEKNFQDLTGIKGNFIEGVQIKKNKRIPDERGTIWHMLTRNDEIFEEFGEIYFSSIYPKVVKAWHWHKEMVLNYTVIQGMIKLVLFDDREDSSTRGNLMEIFLGEENYLLVKVPKKVWNGFKGIGEKKSIVANCASIPHDPTEIFRKEFDTEYIPYSWDLKNE